MKTGQRTTARGKHGFDRDALRSALGPRLLQILFGAWLIVSVFLWPHSRVQAVVAWTGGGLAVALAVVSLWVTSFRLLLGLAGIWLLLGTLMAHASIATLVNNIACALAIIGLSFLPPGEIKLFRRRSPAQ